MGWHHGFCSISQKVDTSAITETDSMVKLHPNVFRISGRESRHRFQINRENYIKTVQIPMAIM